MSQKQVAGWLKGITLSIAGMGLLFFGLVVPYLAWDMAVTYPDYAALRILGFSTGGALRCSATPFSISSGRSACRSDATILFPVRMQGRLW